MPAPDENREPWVSGADRPRPSAPEEGIDWGDFFGKIIAGIILAAIALLIVVPVLIGIGRWTWGWALDDETIPDKPAQVDE